MRKCLISAALLLAGILASSCSQDGTVPGSFPMGGPTFTGHISCLSATKTLLSATDAVLWESTDTVSINGSLFTVTPDKNDPTWGVFTKRSGEDPTGPFNAYYPYNVFDGTAAALPSVQYYAPGKITNNPMYATSESTTLQFHNITALVELTLKGTASVEKIDVTASEGGLSGAFTVVDNVAVLTAEAKAANAGVTLNCAGGAELNDQDGVKFYISIPEGTYNTLTFTITSTDGATFIMKTKDGGVTASANTIYAFECTPDLNNYLCLSAMEDDVEVKLNVVETTANTYEYSLDKIQWHDIVLNTTFVTLAKSGDMVYVRAKTARTVPQEYGYDYVYFDFPKNMEASGNIMYMVDPDGGSLTTITNPCEFLNLFNGTSLVAADRLILPATTLTDFCYEGMFQNCFALTKAPALPAENLEEGYACYNLMFNNCTSLETAPELPAKTLSNMCYGGMFAGCTSLETAPELPSENLTYLCYYGMFEDCTSLKVAPVLPAKTLVQQCYYYMFNGCSNLSSITCLATASTGNYSTTSWVDGVASSGTFITPSEAVWTDGSDGIPSGWTRVDYLE